MHIVTKTHVFIRHTGKFANILTLRRGISAVTRKPAREERVRTRIAGTTVPGIHFVCVHEYDLVSAEVLKFARRNRPLATLGVEVLMPSKHSRKRSDCRFSRIVRLAKCALKGQRQSWLCRCPFKAIKGVEDNLNNQME